MSWYTRPIEPSGLVKYDGDEWTVFTTENSNLPTEHVWNLVADSLGNLWMSGDGLIMYDGNDFTQYTAQNSGLYSINISDIQIDEFNNKWIIHPNAISVYNEDGITSVVEELQLPNAFKLQQNYPNPFNPTTTINYQIPKISFVTLKVYDVLGKEVVALVNEEKPSGNYVVEFDANRLPSGIYFYRLQAGSFVETKKMVLMK
ncbi:MAG: T9SS type A sorting domain-containing protein [Bacteroidetes bacterium]|nr:T9SS type A sorting domain-containing protein [Bacteroidota bacterium]